MMAIKHQYKIFPLCGFITSIILIRKQFFYEVKIRVIFKIHNIIEMICKSDAELDKTSKPFLL